MIKIWISESGVDYDFKLQLGTVHVPEFTENRAIVKARNGVEVLLADPKDLFPSRLLINIHVSEIDAISPVQKAGQDVYLATFLYWVFFNKETIQVFSRTSQGPPWPAYKGQLLQYDPDLAGPVTENELVPVNFPHFGSLGKEVFNFLMWVEANGSFTDWDDLASAGYVNRNA